MGIVDGCKTDFAISNLGVCTAKATVFCKTVDASGLCSVCTDTTKYTLTAVATTVTKAKAGLKYCATADQVAAAKAASGSMTQLSLIALTMVGAFMTLWFK